MKIKGNILALMMVGALLIGGVGAFLISGLIQNNDIGEIANYGSKNPRAIKTNITLERAKQIALDDAKAGNVTRAELDRENGIWVFEIEVVDGNIEKDYKINADTGEIINAYVETDRDLTAQNQSNDNTNHESGNTSANASKPSNAKIGLDKAKEIALKEAKKGNITKAELDRENGILVYEIEVIDGNVEKDYRIDANTGAILKTDIETRRVAQNTTGNNNTSTNTSNNTSNNANAKISLDKAKQIALDNAKKGQITKIELDRENGVLVYEVEVRNGNVEKDYKINAQTGAVVESTVDHDDDNHYDQGSADYHDHDDHDDHDDDDDDHDGDND